MIKNHISLQQHKKKDYKILSLPHWTVHTFTRLEYDLFASIFVLVCIYFCTTLIYYEVVRIWSGQKFGAAWFTCTCSDMQTAPLPLFFFLGCFSPCLSCVLFYLSSYFKPVLLFFFFFFIPREALVAFLFFQPWSPWPLGKEKLALPNSMERKEGWKMRRKERRTMRGRTLAKASTSSMKRKKRWRMKRKEGRTRKTQCIRHF